MDFLILIIRLTTWMPHNRLLMCKAILLHHRVKDIPAVEAIMPGLHPWTIGALHEIKEMICRHTTLTAYPSHSALLGAGRGTCRYWTKGSAHLGERQT